MAPFSVPLVLYSDPPESCLELMKSRHSCQARLWTRGVARAGILEVAAGPGQHIRLSGNITGSEFRLGRKHFNYLTLIVAFLFFFQE